MAGGSGGWQLVVAGSRALGIGRFGKTPAAIPEAVPEAVAVPSIDSYSADADLENTGTTAADAVVRASMVDNTIDKRITGTKIIGTTINGATITDKTGRFRQREGLIARDTVTYLDAGRQPARKTQPAKGLAANTVTYLTKPIPKPTK